MKHQTITPYKPFFLIGWCFAIWGVSVWALHFYGLKAAWPGGIHAEAMTAGFLLCHVLGFLMTAFPNVTGSAPASRGEWLVPAAAMVSAFAILPSENIQSIRLLAGVAIFSLVAFVVRRIKSRSHPITSRPFPPILGFALVGILAGVTGLIFVLAGDQLGHAALTRAGRILYLRIMMIAIVLGVGSLVIPYFSGHSDALIPPEKDLRATRNNSVILISLFAVGVLMECAAFDVAGRIVQAVPVIAVGFWQWRLHKAPPRRTPAARMLRLSSWLFALGIVGSAFLPEHALHLTHLTYVGGLVMMVISVATRVILAHGSQDVLQGEGSKIFYWLSFLIGVAAVTRASIGFTPDLYMSHLAYSALLVALALLIWGFVFFKKMWET